MGPECIQVLRRKNLNHYFGEEATSEDCLYMNIWAPAAAKAGAKLPVIVYIHGGGYTLGSSGMALYGGENIAKKNAVFVNFNFRVGAMGHLAHPELTAESARRASGNYGFMDQVAALRWIRANIGKFGGDPGSVTLTGQSSGAGSIAVLAASPLAKGLFHRAVAMSGAAFDNAFPSLADSEKVGLEVQKAISAKSLADMRNYPATASSHCRGLPADCAGSITAMNVTATCCRHGGQDLRRRQAETMFRRQRWS
jgi:para-nitrobenzyl esterase